MSRLKDYYKATVVPQLQEKFNYSNVMEVPRGSGSGFVWDRDGHIVTNFHVIQGGNASGNNTLDINHRYHTWRGGGIYNWLSSPTIANSSVTLLLVASSSICSSENHASRGSAA